MKSTKNEILVGFISGILGIFVGAGLMYWGRLPDHTIDLLVFTESAFGIGMTVIALVFSLVTVNQVKEIDRRFAEKSTEIDTRFSVQEREVGEDVAKAIQRLRTVNDKIEGLFSQLRSDLNDKIDKTFIQGFTPPLVLAHLAVEFLHLANEREDGVRRVSRAVLG